MDNTNSKKIILIYSANYLPNIGGLEKYTEHLSQALQKLDYQVIIVTNNVFNLKTYEDFHSGVKIIRLPCFALINGRLPIPKPSKEFYKIQKQLHKLPISYVVINTRFYPHTFLGLKEAERHNIRPILIDHGSAYITLGNRTIDHFVKLYEIVITSFLKKHSIDFYGVSNASVNWLKNFNIIGKGTLNNSINADKFRNNASTRDFRKEFNLHENDFIVTFTGRLIPEKGISVVKSVAEKFSKTNPHIHFFIAGDGPLKKILLNANLSNMHLVGNLDSSDISRLLEQSNAFCLPTRSEGFSTSLLEAAACYTTPIITNVGGVEELIPSPDYGIVLFNTNPDEVYKSIEKLFNHPEQNAQMSENIGNRVRKCFSWEITAKKVIEACLCANN